MGLHSKRVLFRPNHRNHLILVRKDAEKSGDHLYVLDLDIGPKLRFLEAGKGIIFN